MATAYLLIDSKQTMNKVKAWLQEIRISKETN